MVLLLTTSANQRQLDVCWEQIQRPLVLVLDLYTPSSPSSDLKLNLGRMAESLSNTISPEGAISSSFHFWLVSWYKGSFSWKCLPDTLQYCGRGRKVYWAGAKRQVPNLLYANALCFWYAGRQDVNLEQGLWSSTNDFWTRPGMHGSEGSDKIVACPTLS